MCIGCWEEYGSPQIATMDVCRIALMSKQIDSFGAFHVVVDDMNVGDSNIEFCMEQDDCTDFESWFGRQLLSLTEDERMSALALADGFWGVCHISDRPLASKGVSKQTQFR